MVPAASLTSYPKCLLPQVVTDPTIGLAFKSRRNRKASLHGSRAAIHGVLPRRRPPQLGCSCASVELPASAHDAPACPHSLPAAGPKLMSLPAGPSTASLQLIVVDPAAASPGDYTTRTEVASDEYEQAVIFDHVIGWRT